MRYNFLSLFILANVALFSQRKLVVLDSSTSTPIVGVSFYGLSSKATAYSNLDGEVILNKDFLSTDTILISCLGYERIMIEYSLLSNQIRLAPRTYVLKETTIKPLSPRDYIQLAFDHFHINHLPIPYSQSVFYREEFIINDRYLRFQEMDMTIYQFPKTTDKRRFYISGSYPKVNKLYRKDDTVLMNNTKSALGKIVGNQLNFNYLSLYSYTKGVNILNFIFTQLLEDKGVIFKKLGVENIKGYQAIHIRGDHYKGGELFYSSHIYIEESSYAVVHFSVLASDNNLVKQFTDFKTRTFLWVLGIKVNIKKYYTKIQFVKNKEGFWSVEDFMLMFPVQVKKKKMIDGYLNLGYRMNPNLILNPPPLTYQVYEQNQYLLDHYRSQSRFVDQIQYGIPISTMQLKRLELMSK